MTPSNYLLTLILSFVIGLPGIQAQYSFTEVKSLPCTEVKSQDRTGTCWSFATSSFLESEVMRQKNMEIDISEMFAVRNIYRDKAYNYVFRQGKANFSQGSLSHDVMRSVTRYGALPEVAYPGRLPADEKFDHSEMERALKGLLDGVIKGKRLTDKWDEAVEAVLDVYMGELPDEVRVNGKAITPDVFAEDLGIDPDNYISLTSFSHHPFYESFILEIPDNYSNGQFHNLPIDELMQVIDHAIMQGFTIAWDGDVSEKGFNARQGIAVLPKDANRDDLFEKPGDEVEVNQVNRQKNFESYSTTDDHLMHLIGKAKDQNGTTYYTIKNSWGEISEYKGFLYMSEAYTKMKTMAIFLHKDGIPTEIRKKLNI